MAEAQEESPSGKNKCKEVQSDQLMAEAQEESPPGKSKCKASCCLVLASARWLLTLACWILVAWQVKVCMEKYLSNPSVTNIYHRDGPELGT